MNDDYERFIVTTDPEKLANLRKSADELDSFALGELAMSLGMYPPDYSEGEHHSITHYGPPGHEGPPLLVWSVGLWSPQPEDLYEEDDDGTTAAAWESIGVGVVDPSSTDPGEESRAQVEGTREEGGPGNGSAEPDEPRK